MEGHIPSRDPRSSIDGVPLLASSDTHQHADSAQRISFADFTAMQQTLAEMKSMMDRAASGPNPVGELLIADPSNHCPRPSAFQSLSSVDKGWVPLLPMEAVPLYQTVQARADGAKSLGSVAHELPFLYSMLSYGNDVSYNLGLCELQLQQGKFPAEAFQACRELLNKVLVLGGKRLTEIQVLVDHGAATASLMHLPNFGAVGSSFMDAGDRALLLDVKKQLLKDQKKQMAKGKQSGLPFGKKSGSSASSSGLGTPPPPGG